MNTMDCTETGAGDMNYTVVVLGGVLILSIAWYYFPKYGGVHVGNIVTLSFMVLSTNVTVFMNSGLLALYAPSTMLGRML
jgi:hypothetical protein